MWNHNTHFHSYLLRQFPLSIHRALDVGCGLGLFALKLATRADVVDALDVDSAILNQASSLNAAPNISYLHSGFLEADLPEASYDVIVSIASLHHMDLEAALKKMRLLLRPSGTLLILGLYRETTITDYIYSAISVPLNLIYLSWRRSSMVTPTMVTPTMVTPTMVTPTIIAPTRPAQLSLNQIKAAANDLLPDCSLRRHLFWRYSLIWRKHDTCCGIDRRSSKD